MADKRSVQKLKLFNSLCDSGCKPPKNTKAYEEKVQEQLYVLLCVDRQECSEATTKAIDREANLFRKSATKHFIKHGSHYERMREGDYLKDHISVEIGHISQDIPELAVSAAGSGRKSGPYKSFEDKSQSGQDKAAAAVRAQHPPGAILKAAPKAASTLGMSEFATAMRLMEKDPENLPAKAISGMTDKRMYSAYDYIKSFFYL